MSAADRSCFLLDWWRFAASIFSLALLERFRFCLLIFSILSLSALTIPFCMRSILSSSTLLATKRLTDCERSRWHLTMIPVGIWRRNTQVEVLLTFCPPGPDDLTKDSSRSSSETPMWCILSRSAFSFSGDTLKIDMDYLHWYCVLDVRLCCQSVVPHYSKIRGFKWKAFRVASYELQQPASMQAFLLMMTDCWQLHLTIWIVDSLNPVCVLKI